MKRLIPILMAMIILGACSSGYTAEPTSDQTPSSIPKCFLIERYDDGHKDDLGKGVLGVYCKENDK